LWAGETGRGARLGWFSSANDIGATAGPLIGGFVLYFTASYPVTYVIVGALGVLTLIVVLLLPDVDRPAREAKTFAVRAAEFRQGLAEVLRTPPIFAPNGCRSPEVYIVSSAERRFTQCKESIASEGESRNSAPIPCGIAAPPCPQAPCERHRGSDRLPAAAT
jgi:MFS family permease